MSYRILPAFRFATRHLYRRDPWWCHRFSGPGLWAEVIWPWAGTEEMLKATENQSSDPSRFKIAVNLKHFRPEDIKVKLVENQLDVRAKREEKTESGFYLNREFSQSYVLPPSVDLNGLVSTLDDGQLTLEAPIIKGPEEREIPVVERAETGSKVNAPKED